MKVCLVLRLSLTNGFIFYSMDPIKRAFSNCSLPKSHPSCSNLLAFFFFVVPMRSLGMADCSLVMIPFIVSGVHWGGSVSQTLVLPTSLSHSAIILLAEKVSRRRRALKRGRRFVCFGGRLDFISGLSVFSSTHILL